MSGNGGHPAVLAGLLGLAEWNVPTVAVAAPQGGLIDVVADSVLLQFVLGCAAGAAVAGAASLIVDQVARVRAARTPSAPLDVRVPMTEVSDAQEPRPQRWSLGRLRSRGNDGDVESTGSLKRLRAGRVTIDRANLAQGERREPSAAIRRAARHASGTVVDTPPARRAARHFAVRAEEQATPETPARQAAHDESGVAVVEPVRGRHFAAAVAARQADVEALRQAEHRRQEQVGAHAEAPSGAEARRSRERALAQLPVIEAAQPSAAANPEKAASTSRSRAMRAAGARKATLRERMAQRTSSVREVLADRLSPEALWSIPRITRADGTVADVTPSWFDQTLAPVLASITGIGAKLEDTDQYVQLDTSAPEAGAAAPVASAPVPAGTASAPAANAPARVADVPTAGAGEPAAVREGKKSRTAYITERVAEVDRGVFPERRSAKDLEHEDVWEQALAAMGETIREETPVFQDVVGGPASIDDPDGIEDSTGFIPFRVPAGRPEVVDTETYIDYLLHDEISHNESRVVRRMAHNYLRVIEGGTNAHRGKRLRGDTGARPRGRHFAPASLAAQA